MYTGKHDELRMLPVPPPPPHARVVLRAHALLASPSVRPHAASHSPSTSQPEQALLRMPDHTTRAEVPTDGTAQWPCATQRDDAERKCKNRIESSAVNRRSHITTSSGRRAQVHFGPRNWRSQNLANATHAHASTQKHAMAFISDPRSAVKRSRSPQGESWQARGGRRR
jgi:hypothetical protein